MPSFHLLTMVLVFHIGVTYSVPINFLSSLEKCNFIDMTHPFDETTLHWPTQKPFKKTLFAKGYNDTYGWYYSAYDVETAEHTGTHLDAPVHFYEGMQSTEQIPITQLIGEACVIDVRAQVAANHDYEISKKDFLSWEMNHGSLEGCILLAYTGFEHKWSDRVAYLGGDDPEAVNLHFPGFHGDSIKWLVENRHIKAVGIDTASNDNGQSRSFRTHVYVMLPRNLTILSGHDCAGLSTPEFQAYFIITKELCQRNIPGLENVDKISQLPSRGATLIALPMKITGGSGGPVRIVAFGADSKCRRGKRGAFLPSGGVKNVNSGVGVIIIVMILMMVKD